MEMIPFSGNRRRKGYSRLSPSNRRNLKMVKLKRSWRLRLRLGRKLRLASPLKLWCRFKNAYMKMMLKFADFTATSSASTNVFGPKSIPTPPTTYSKTEFQNRLVLEIYKSMVASLELGYND